MITLYVIKSGAANNIQLPTFHTLKVIGNKASNLI